MPTVDYTWIDMGNDWHYVMVNAENGDWLEELAVLRNEGGTNWYDFYVDQTWIGQGCWSTECKQFVEQFFDLLNA